MSQHTPGPWEVYRDGANYHVVKAGSVEHTGSITKADWIADLEPDATGHDGEQCAANARLIAQAPAMLALLREVPTTSLSGVQYTAMGRWREKVDALIATLDEPSSQP